jgi:hypothetical protein
MFEFVCRMCFCVFLNFYQHLCEFVVCVCVCICVESMCVFNVYCLFVLMVMFMFIHASMCV